MKKEQKQSKLTGLMALIVFSAFAVCLLLVLLTGANVYSRLTRRSQEIYAARTAAQYVSTRVRQARDVVLEDFGGQEALVFREEIDGVSYLTRVYCYDGFLWELFCAESGSFSPCDGEKVLEAKKLSLHLEEDCLYADLTLPDGTLRQLVLYLRNGKEICP